MGTVTLLLAIGKMGGSTAALVYGPARVFAAAVYQPGAKAASVFHPGAKEAVTA